ncbi:MAG: hypothetical protein ACLFU6_00115 [Candidatus Hydrogenedentota bacterium]
MDRMKGPALVVLFLMAALGGGGCAAGPGVVPYDAFSSVREADQERPGEWRIEDNRMVNVIPEEAASDAVAAGEEGASMALVEGFRARDVVVKGQLGFEGYAAPALVFRAQEEDGVVDAMYMLVVNTDGVFLWRLLDGNWMAIVRHYVPLPPETMHTVRAEARGDTIEVALDGEDLFDTNDTLLMQAGGAGVSAREGVCYIADVGVESLD